MITAYAYHQILENAGLPIAGVSLNGNVRVNQWLTPPTPAQAAQAAALLANARPVEFSAPAAQFAYATGVTVTIATAADVTSVDVLVRGQSVSVPIVQGVGTLQINASAPTLPPHIVIQAQNQAVFGYNTLTLEAV